MEQEKSTATHRGIPLFWLPLVGQIVCMILPFQLPDANQIGNDTAGLVVLLLLAATLFGICNVICAVRLGRKRRSAHLRPMALWGKVVLSVLSAVGAVGLLASSLIVGATLTVFMGIFSLIGTAMVVAIALSWLYCMGLSVSAYTIAIVWVAVKEKRMNPAMAVIHTLLQFFIVIDLIDTIVVFFATRPAKQVAQLE